VDEADDFRATTIAQEIKHVGIRGRPVIGKSDSPGFITHNVRARIGPSDQIGRGK